MARSSRTASQIPHEFRAFEKSTGAEMDPVSFSLFLRESGRSAYAGSLARPS
jgi:hypothetical protein